MQQYSSSSEESNSFSTQGKSNPMVQARVAAYLDRTCAPLFVSLSQEEALQQRAEMQSHLESLIEAYQELGASETHAVMQALEQFGKEQSVAQAWQQECETTEVEAGRGSFSEAMRPVILYSAVNWVVCPLLVQLYGHLINRHPHVGKAESAILLTLAMVVFFGECSLFPAFLGFLAGRRARGKILIAAVFSLPCVVLGCESVATTVYQHLGLFPPTSAGQSEYHLYHVTPMDQLFPLLVLGVFGSLGAMAGRWKSRRVLRLAGNR